MTAADRHPAGLDACPQALPTVPVLAADRLRLRPLVLADAEAVEDLLLGDSEAVGMTERIPDPCTAAAVRPWIAGRRAPGELA